MSWSTLVLNDAVSTYVVFLGGLAVGQLTHLYGVLRKRTKRVLVERIGDTSLLSVGSEVRSKLRVSYGDKQVTSFHATTFRLHNRSREVVDQIDLRLYIDTEHGALDIYELQLNDKLEMGRTPTPSVEQGVDGSGKFIRTVLPFLNSAYDHDDEIELQVFASAPVSLGRVIGGGRGWTVRYFDKAEYERQKSLFAKSPNPLVMARAVAKMLALSRLPLLP